MQLGLADHNQTQRARRTICCSRLETSILSICTHQGQILSSCLHDGVYFSLILCKHQVLSQQPENYSGDGFSFYEVELNLARKPASPALVHMPRMQSLVCEFVKKCKEFDRGSSAHQGEKCNPDV